MKVICMQCKVPRELTKDCGTVCRKCASDNRRLSNRTDSGYMQTCVECGQVRITKSNTKADICKSCSSKANGKSVGKSNSKSEEDKKRYEAYCTGCKETRWIVRNPDYLKTTLCGACSRRANGIANAKLDSKKKPRKKYDRSKWKSVQDRKAQAKARTFDKAVKKEQEKNRKHKEFIEAEKNSRKIKDLSQQDMDDMISQFYKDNEVVCVVMPEPYGETTQKIIIGD